VPLSRRFGEKTQEQWQKSRDLVKDSVETLKPDAAAEWKARLAPIAVEWVQSVPDGAKVLDAYRAEAAAARAGESRGRGEPRAARLSPGTARGGFARASEPIRDPRPPASETEARQGDMGPGSRA